MERRLFIRLSSYTAAAISLPLLNGCWDNRLNSELAKPQLLMHILDKKTIKDIGENYRKQYPSEDSKSKLSDLLIAGSPITDRSESPSVQSYFDKKIQDDFSSGHTTMVNGWILSVTEARQCALLSLI